MGAKTSSQNRNDSRPESFPLICPICRGTIVDCKMPSTTISRQAHDQNEEIILINSPQEMDMLVRSIDDIRRRQAVNGYFREQIFSGVMRIMIIGWVIYVVLKIIFLLLTEPPN